MSHITPDKKSQFHLNGNANDFGFILAAESNVGSYKSNAWYSQSYLLQTYCHMCTNQLPDSFWRPVE